MRLRYLLILVLINIQTYSQFTEINSGVTSQLNSCSNSKYGYIAWGGWICGNNGTIVKGVSNISGQWGQWRNLSGHGVPTNINLTNINAVDTTNAFVCGTSGSITYVWKTSNGGVNWFQVFSQTNGFINAVYMKNSSFGFMEGNPVSGRWSLWKTINGGINWDSAGLYLTQSGTETGFPNSLINPISPYSTSDTNKIWFGTNNYHIYYSSNYGQSWVAQSTSPEQYSFCLAYGPESTLCIGGSNYVLSSTNQGTNWITYTVPGTGNITGITVCFGFYLTRGNQIYQKYFSNWILNYTASGGNYIYVDNKGYGNYVDHYGVRSNGGITFIMQGMGIEKISTEVPKSFSLYQNYPNPFNPTTKIKFAIPLSRGVDAESGRGVLTKLIIYDILGREVATLVNKNLKPGTYAVDFDGTNIPSGVYFYKLITTNFTETKKMVLIK